MTPQHETRGLVAAMQCRDANNKEMERQVKKYGRDQLAPPLHAHDGLDKTAVDNEVFTRALVLKGKGDMAQNSKTKEPTYRLRQHLFKGKNRLRQHLFKGKTNSVLQEKNNGDPHNSREIDLYWFTYIWQDCNLPKSLLYPPSSSLSSLSSRRVLAS